ncbi:MAG: thiamine-phosphate pyrophosphorylase [Gammaproteobacteria bacterium]|jgi:thiamine-phosphate pyrophosphorylase
MHSQFPLPQSGLYAITDQELTRDRGLLTCVKQVLDSGAAIVQYRDKTASGPQLRERAESLLELCRKYEVPLIVNDDVQLALAIGADGVHVGRDDDAVANARATLGPTAIVGASCYHELSLAQRAVDDGATYIAFGRFFTSKTKPGQALADLNLLMQARQQFTVPIAAIGGITADNGRSLVESGANLLAVIHDLWCEPDCRPRAKALVECFEALPNKP